MEWRVRKVVYPEAFSDSPVFDELLPEVHAAYDAAALACQAEALRLTEEDWRLIPNSSCLINNECNTCAFQVITEETWLRLQREKAFRDAAVELSVLVGNYLENEDRHTPGLDRPRVLALIEEIGRNL